MGGYLANRIDDLTEEVWTTFPVLGVTTGNADGGVVEEILRDFGANWYVYLSMPVLAAVIGYVTKILAIEMMFKPVEFVGRPPILGWQGIVPRRAARMASIACDTMTSKLISPGEIFERLDAERVAKEI
ncbi:MAG: hypothetical protein QOG20_922, partial [Pseudonocardiales bacterium]|nr:hypothetical protein [Pseudonocardiales bacterium]